MCQRKERVRDRQIQKKSHVSHEVWSISEFDRRLGLPENTVLKQILKGEYNSNGAWQRMEKGELLPAEFSREFNKELSEAVSYSLQQRNILGTFSYR